MCGIIGLYGKNRKMNYEIIYQGLRNLQHRGIESAGLAYYSNNCVHEIKNLGKVKDALPASLDQEFFAGVGHVRYATSRNKGQLMLKLDDTQAFIDEDMKIAFVHNGHIIGVDGLAEHFGIVNDSMSDSAFLFKLILTKIGQLGGIEQALIWLVENISGVYSIVMLYKNKLYALRDRVGIRPLWLGRQMDDSSNYIVVSETGALPSDYLPFREIKPGEIIRLDKTGINYILQIGGNEKMCSFEYIYFQSHRSFAVETFRFKSGKLMAMQEKEILADIVVCMPNTAIPSAQGFAKQLGLPYFDYIQKIKDYRSFIAPDQETRRIYCQNKFLLSPKLEGKRIYLVDDSIVRGTTMGEMTKKLRDIGVKEIHVRSVSPPVRFTCSYGIDIPTQTELIAHDKTVEEISKEIKVDSLKYLTISQLETLLGKNICTHCFSGTKPFIPDW